MSPILTLCPPPLVAGFSGAHCEIDIDECDPDPCHYGTCKDSIAAFTCLCQPGYTGHRCDININECQSQPCKNGGTCQDRNNAYNCLCLKGTTGEREEPPEGSTQVCRAGAAPHPQAGWPSATAVTAWGVFGEGKFSRFGARLSGTTPQPGAGEPLVVEALCCGAEAAVSAGGLRFASSAGPGTPLTAPLSSPGPNCEINLDDCASNPCDYGKCIDKINGYECTCETGYTGESRAWWLPWHPGDLIRIQPGAGEPWGVPRARGSAGMPAAGGAPRSPGRGCVEEGRCCHPARRRFCTLQCSCLFRRVTLAQAEIKGVSGAANSTPAAPTPMGIGLLPCPTGLFDRCWKWRRALMGAAPTSPRSRGPLSSARREPQ